MGAFRALWPVRALRLAGRIEAVVLRSALVAGGQMAEHAERYGLATGTADADRLGLLAYHYNPASRAILEAAGLGAGQRVADIGCGHGAMTAWLAECVGERGSVLALDSSAAQLELAAAELAHFDNIEYLCASVEAAPIADDLLDIAFCRFLVLHLRDPALAVRKIAAMLKPGGCLVVEVADIGALRFSPGGPDSELWAPWWFALGKVRGASYDVGPRFDDLLRDAGLQLERMDEYQPVSTRREAKLLHALGFRQLIPDYIEHAGAHPDAIQRHLAFLDAALDDPGVRVALYRTTQYIARKPLTGGNS
jgi:ubiquinone/menaquinone biosynthesis C-methylase UbiE